MSTINQTAHPLRDAQVILTGHRKADGQRVAIFESSEGELLEYEVFVGRPPVRDPESA